MKRFPVRFDVAPLAGASTLQLGLLQQIPILMGKQMALDL
jgi:hypothetical protein